jgi:carbonic anhydrase
MTFNRRHLLARLASLTGLGAAAVAAPGAVAAAPLAPRLEVRLSLCRPPGDPLEALLERNRRFSALWQEAARQQGTRVRSYQLAELWQQGCQLNPVALAAGQRPWAALLGCADSRVSPEWLFASGPGELFEVRSAGNTAADACVASLEYAVAELAVPLILVLGHSGCGAVQAALGHGTLTPLLSDLVRPIRAALPTARSAAAVTPDEAVRLNVRAAAAALPERSPLLREAVAGGRLRIVAAVCDIGSGLVRLV